MPSVTRMFQILTYLNSVFRSRRYVHLEELASWIDMDKRQTRRYIDALNSDYLSFYDSIESKRGKDGGYRLKENIDGKYFIPEGLVCSVLLSKNNDETLEIFRHFPDCVDFPVVEGDNQILPHAYVNLKLVATALQKKKTITFHYQSNKTTFPLTVKGYRLLYTNQTYYLRALYKTNDLKVFDINKMIDIRINEEEYVIDQGIMERARALNSRYGVNGDDQEYQLQVHYENDRVLSKFQRYFENKGSVDKEKQIFTVKTGDMHELFYPLFRIGTQDFKILNPEIKEAYLDYLKKQIYSLKKK